MSIRNKVPSSVILTAAVALFGAVGFGQEAQKQGQEQDRQRTAPSTMTGCLTKGDTAGQYAFTDTKSGNKTTVVPSSGVDLDKHAANHTVKLTGTLSEDGKTLTATNVEHVSATCEATK